MLCFYIHNNVATGVNEKKKNELKHNVFSGISSLVLFGVYS